MAKREKERERKREREKEREREREREKRRERERETKIFFQVFSTWPQAKETVLCKVAKEEEKTQK